MQKHLTELTPQELENFLLKKFDVGLYPFAFILISIFTRFRIRVNFFCDPEHEDFIKKEKIKTKKMNSPSKEFWLEKICRWEQDYYSGLRTKSIRKQYDAKVLNGLKKRFLNLKKRVIETIIDYDVLFLGKTDQKRQYNKIPYKEFENQFRNKYELESFFDLINKYLKQIDFNLRLAKRGISISKRNLAFAMWVFFLKDYESFLKKRNRRIPEGYNKKIDWTVLSNLLDWFWRILSPYELYCDLKPHQNYSDPAYLENQFFKHKKRWGEYYRSYDFRHYATSRGAAVFGRKRNEINIIPKKLLEEVINKKNWPCREFFNETFLPLVVDLSEKNPNFNYMLVFPDYSYLII